MPYAPLLTLILLIFGSGFLSSLVSLEMRQAGISDWGIGLTQACYYLGLLISSPKSSSLIARVGHIRGISAACALQTLATLLLPILPVHSWFLFRLLAGFSGGAFYVGIESWLLHEFSKTHSGKALGLYNIALYVTLAFSQLLLNKAHDDFMLAIMLSAFFSAFSIIPICITHRSAPKISLATPESFAKMLGLTPLAFIGSFLGGMMLGALYAFMPLYGKDHGLNPSYVMLVMILGGGLLQWPIGKLSDTIGRRKTLAGLSFSGLLALILLSFFSSYPVFVGLTLFVLGGAAFAVYPVAVSLGCDRIKEKDIIKLAGALLCVYSMGAFFSPPLVPLLRPWTPDYLLYMVSGYFALLLFFLYKKDNST